MADNKPGLPEHQIATGVVNTVPDFILFYRAGENTFPMWKYFQFRDNGRPGELHKAIERGKRHCDTMNYRFLRVTPFCRDLDAEEKKSQAAFD